ncbi:von Willebrand factor type A domain-containing protein [Stieleria sp. ICT_E10.1]|uniref:vWA domain-containing protein n=1 Tax=Stieleria sedimenti TaxID=2976331 RepID=UPI00217FFBC2|nr:von Willebrand factor type A domain-containing protein [Stieleria sedimenti]MCS7471408.1 von Willebrand factor type A domain-containing protein [Stieleria sedimenti]
MTSEPTDQQEGIEERATAFVFGELEREEATEFMKMMDASPEVRAIVASVRDAVGAVKAELAADTMGVNLADRQRIENAIRDPLPQPPPVVATTPDASTRTWVLGLAIAATLLLVSGLTLPALNRVITANTDTRQLRDQISQMQSQQQRLVAEKRSVEMELASVRAMLADAAAPPAQPNQANSSTTDVEAIESPGPTLASSDAEAQDLGATAMDTAVEQPGLATDSQPEPAAALENETPAPTGTPNERTMLAESEQADDDGSPGPPAGPATATPMNPLLAQPVPPPYWRPRRPPQGPEFRIGAVDDMEEMMGMGMGMAGDALATGQPRPSLGEAMAEIPSLMEHMEVGGGDQFAPIIENPFLPVGIAPLSTFSIDVDTAAYAKLRMNLTQYNQWPNPDAVRIEELVNYFDYHYAPPQDDRPFAAAMEIAECPWNPKHRLARIGIKAKVADVDRPPSNLVFLLDVSGSMNRPNKLPLVVNGMKMLVNQLGENDSVAIVVYAGAAGLVLDATTGDRKKLIVDSLDRLRAGGSTNGGHGIELAYSIARDHFVDGGTNRVILCSDGDFNVGLTDTDELIRLVENNAKSNIFLTVLGFGSDNHNDAMMEQISNKGNGNYAFIDSQDEARKVLVEQMQGSLMTVAKDVKIQVEFNPMEVESYRLIGYENRILNAKDFDDDDKDGGEIGAGHTVTALYEIVPKSKLNSEDPALAPAPLEELKYQRPIRYSEQAASGEMLTLKLRYKPPTDEQSKLIEFAVKDSGKGFNRTDRDFQFAASVAAFAMLLRNSPHKGNCNFDMVEEIATAGAVDDRSGYRDEFLSLVRRAKQLGEE